MNHDYFVVSKAAARPGKKPQLSVLLLISSRVSELSALGPGWQLISAAAVLPMRCNAIWQRIHIPGLKQARGGH